MQSPESPRILRAQVHEVGRLDAELVIGRVIAEGVSQMVPAFYECAACFQRRIQPFVGIHSDGVCQLEMMEILRRVGQHRIRRSQPVQ